MSSLKQNQIKNQNKNVISPSLSLEDRLKVIANLIVDRIIEDQINETLQLKVAVNEQHE